MKLSIDMRPFFVSPLKKMGIKELVPFRVDLDYRPIDIPIPPITTRSGQGVGIDDVSTSGNGILTYDGQQIILFIPDHSYYFDNVINGLSDGNRFHVADCQTLDEMRRQNRFNRYRVTTNTDGYFEINDGHSRKKEVKLKVCRNCLSKLNYKNYRYNRERIFAEFDLAEFFKHYQTSFKNIPNVIGENGIGYSADWREISQKYRAHRNYCCEKCKVNLKQYSHLLDVHHKNGVKRENSFENLEVLCRLCHSQEALHQHMIISETDKQLIMRLRTISFLE